MKNIVLHATAAFGIESVLKTEITQLGFKVLRAENGYIDYEADLKGIATSNMWLRTADRVYLKLAEFKAVTFTELFDGIKAIDWVSILPSDAKVIIQAKSIKSTLFSLSDIQSISKKAVLDKLKLKYNLEWFPETGVPYTIHVDFLKDHVQVLLDTTGPGLHKRGYRRSQNDAPIKETLASALVMLANWNTKLPLVDPMCGSGTLLIEAAMIGMNIAPGHNREFAFESFFWMPQALLDGVKKEAKDGIKKDPALIIRGYDKDPKALQAAKGNAMHAGVSSCIQWIEQDVANLELSEPFGSIITNPPYGERLEEQAQIESLYTLLGKKMRPYPKWSVFVITSYDDFERCYGSKSTKNRKLFNGRIQCYYYQYYGKRDGNQGGKMDA